MDIPFIEDRYPKTIQLKTGEEVTLRLLESGDSQLLLDFFNSIPADDRLYFRHNVTDPNIVNQWCSNINPYNVTPLVAVYNGRIIGEASLHQDSRGWMRSVGQLRIVILPEFRGRGLSRSLIGEVVYCAENFGLKKLDIEMVDKQNSEPLIKMGFMVGARLSDHVIDFNGGVHDYLILVHDLIGPIEEIGAR